MSGGTVSHLAHSLRQLLKRRAPDLFSVLWLAITRPASACKRACLSHTTTTSCFKTGTVRCVLRMCAERDSAMCLSLSARRSARLPMCGAIWQKRLHRGRRLREVRGSRIERKERNVGASWKLRFLVLFEHYLNIFATKVHT